MSSLINDAGSRILNEGMDTEVKPKTHQGGVALIFALLLAIVILVGTYLRFVGLNWGEYQYLHPDERFLVWVGTDISPVQSLAEYWNTAVSSLNPHNRGHSFYVYGTLPMFLARFIVEWVYRHSGFNEMTNIGRILSAGFDLATVLLVYLVGKRVYSRRVGLLAAAFSALAVLQIQHAHFFTMDTFTTFFAMLTIYFAVRVAYDRIWRSENRVSNPRIGLQTTSSDEQANAHPIEGSFSIKDLVNQFVFDPMFVLCLGFGIALGMAMASKINSAPLALVLPGAMLIQLAGLNGEEQRRRAWQAFGYLILAGAVSFIVFRICQPYAFSGPGFLGIKPNPAWLANLNELRNQAGGDVDFPPAMQWARRPVWFAWKNMVLWGMGLPLGLLSWAGFLWAGWRMLHREWQRHILLWGWTAFYFTWQSLIFNPSMRYQLLVYPILVIFAAWGVIRLYDLGKQVKRTQDDSPRSIGTSSIEGWKWQRPVAIVIGGSVLIATAAYAFAFSTIYTRPITRVAASRWIYQNIPGPITLPIQTENGIENQPLAFPYDYVLRPELPYTSAFTAKSSGTLSEVRLNRVVDPQTNLSGTTFLLVISEGPGGTGVAATGSLTLEPPSDDPSSDVNYPFILNQPLPVIQGQEYFVDLRLEPGQDQVVVSGSLNLVFQVGLDINQALQSGETITQSIPIQNATIGPSVPYTTTFISEASGVLVQVYLTPVPGQSSVGLSAQLSLVLSANSNGEGPLAVSSIEIGDRSHENQPGAAGHTLPLDEPVELTKGQTYHLTIFYDGNGEGVTLRGAGVANEGAWDDGLPLRVDEQDGFGGIYTPGLNFDMYEDDNPSKLSRFYNILDRSDYLLISSNRQWGSLPRLPERFPMNTEYYRRLLGCPLDKTIEWCYQVAKPGMFQGDLGFNLVQVFQSDPALGKWNINDQLAEEAFTVYDHPKVLIFQKRPDYDPQRIRAILGAVDLSNVIHVTPKRAGSLSRDMMLPPAQLTSQREGGTWSELFNTDAWQNRWPGLGAILWYLVIGALGWVAYPLVRFALPGLPDRGYPLARTAGLLVLSYLVWLGGSLGIPFHRLSITLAFALIGVISGCLAYLQRHEIRMELRERRRYFLLIEGLFLAFFIFDLLIRLGNPDLWHPWKGGEKPMDFSYFNAILKSTTFPPYDPWFSGGYINYYYYGFILVGVIVKWLGIVPAIAYNLIIPTIFSLIALGAFSIGWNLIGYTSNGARDQGSGINSLKTIVGLAAAIGMAVLGNLGIVRMIYQGYQRLAAPGGNIEAANIITRWIWAVKGAVMAFLGTPLPYGIADWYWNPSRVIPAPNEVEPITEFPFFTVLYGDPHAHLFAMPLALLAISWGLSVLFNRAWRGETGEIPRLSYLQIGVGFILGGLAIGALWPTNTWDLPVYLGLGLLALGYAIWISHYPGEVKTRSLSGISSNLIKVMLVAGGLVLLVGLAFLFYRPYAQWYVQGYTSIELWKGTKTLIWSYLTHWGLFLFLIISWMVWETRDWMASTPLSSLRKLDPYRGLIGIGLMLLLGGVVVLLFVKVAIAWLVLPLAVWAAVMQLRPGLSLSKRAVLVMVAGGLLLTLMVEVIVLKGDIARMNTVFKFYLQVWTLFSVSAAAALGWLLLAQSEWRPSWRSTWQVVLFLLVASTALYPFLGGIAKVKDRMVPEAPHTLDGMAYMKYATYDDLNTIMDLNQDYLAIRWLQENVRNSPVIVEGNMVEYHWGTRNTIYTGLPNVVGWNWHQRQQRATGPENLISERITDVNDFYLNTDIDQARSFLNRYQIKYIILGQLERALYPGPGLDKFEELDGSLWREVYRVGETVIYEVMSG